MNKTLELFIDGACKGNPGPAAVGAVIKDNGKTIRNISKAIGHATNNIAEYMALVYALQEALILRADKIRVYTDSELLCKQVNGSYRIKNPQLKFLYDQVEHLLSGFKDAEIKHIPREKNRGADRLASKAISKEQVKATALMFDIGEESPSSEG